MVDMFSPPKFNVKKVLYTSFAWNKVCLEKIRIGTWRQMKEDMKQVKVLKKEHLKQGDEQTDLYIIIKLILIHKKYR